jgi:hypothetical protein
VYVSIPPIWPGKSGSVFTPIRKALPSERRGDSSHGSAGTSTMIHSYVHTQLSFLAVQVFWLVPYLSGRSVPH